MEEKKRLAVVTLLLTVCLGTLLVSEETACTPDGGGSACEDCIVEQMKYSCPKCVPILQCMGRCLWGGSSRSKCGTRCECDGALPTLAQCKSCMSRCKCSCDYKGW